MSSKFFDRVFGKGVPQKNMGMGLQSKPSNSTGNNDVSGVGSSVIQGGWLSNNEKDAKLRNRQRYETFGDILANTSIVAAGTRFFLNLIAKSDWKFEFEDKYDPEIEDALYNIMDKCNTPWYRVVRRTAMYRFHGYGLQEWSAKKLDDGTIGYFDIQPRPQFTIEQWDVDPATNIVQGVVQRAPQDGQRFYIPRDKMIYALDDSISDTPEGLGLYRHLVEDAERLKIYLQLEGMGFDSDLRGIPVGRAPIAELYAQERSGAITKEQRMQLEAGMRSFMESHVRGTNTSLLLDSAVYTDNGDNETPSTNKMWDVSLLTGGNSSAEAVAKAIDRLNYSMARVLGVEGLLVGGSSTGSHAMSKDKSANLYLIVDSTLKELSEVYEKDWLGPIWKMNGWPENKKPKMKTESIQFQDVAQITKCLADMAAAGAVLAPDDPAINDVRDIIGLQHATDINPAGLSLFDDPNAPPQQQPFNSGSGQQSTKPPRAPVATPKGQPPSPAPQAARDVRNDGRSRRAQNNAPTTPNKTGGKK